MCVFLVSRVPDIPLLYDWVHYHWGGGGGGIFNDWIPNPLSNIISALKLRVPSGLSGYGHARNDAWDNIIHAYMQILSNTTPISNDDS